MNAATAVLYDHRSNSSVTRAISRWRGAIDLGGRVAGGVGARPC